MREIKFKGKTAFITEKEWKGLLQRFDYKNAKDDRILIPCNCCVKYGACAECPLNVFKDRVGGYHGCYVLYRIFDKKGVVGLKSSFISWCYYDTKKAKIILKKIHQALLALPEKE
jgi:hypothetical protein